MDQSHRPLGRARDLAGLLGWLGVAFTAAAVGAVASAEARPFYHQLVLPEWAPPGWVFGPVWSVLYALMGIAAWLVWRWRGFASAPIALGLFLFQLTFNTLWSWLFFAWRQGGLAFADAFILWLFVLATMIAIWQVRVLAGALLVPYMAWVTYAVALSYSVWRRNPGLLG